MAEIIGVSSWIFAGIRWGDWRNWRMYYGTILYFILGDVLYYYVSYNHRLWSLIPTWPLKNELTCIAGEFIVFASTILIFLGRYPAHRFLSAWWTALWVIIYTANEWILIKTGTFKYEHGWTLFHSFLFSILMFILIRLHHKKPVLTILISIPISIILIYLNSIPIK
ncbi:CBO0543 family protein [Neobacillus drentensis]|uniref:CBO0543 family protein n=1 Tax=Neobacillus drentensis TaxID=220684 RepID=UPI002FFEE884